MGLTIVNYWRRLSDYPEFIQIALMTATPRLQSLIVETLEYKNNTEETFKHLHLTLGFKTVGRQGIYRREQMESFQPYFKYIDRIHLSNFSEICLKHEWDEISQVLEPLMKDKRFRRCVEIDTSRLEDSLRGDRGFIYWWISDRKAEGWSHRKTVGTLLDWFKQHQSEQALEVISKPLLESGKRTDYELLEIMLKNMDNLSNKESILNRLYFNIYSRTLE